MASKIVYPRGSVQGDIQFRERNRAERLAPILERASWIIAGKDIEISPAPTQPTGLISDFGYSTSTSGSRMVENWDPDRDRRERKARNQRNGAMTRRARIMGSPLVEKIDRPTIIARDKSTCYLCGEACEPDDIHLDHVIPLSAGGTHTADNIKVTHARCNLDKGSRIISA